LKIGGPLDRYVFVEFWKILVSTALGFPLLLVIIDLTDNLEKYLARNLPRRDIALSYLYWIPESMFMVLPAAVLFATIFSIGAFTRHSEITAAKASGISFYRLAFPIFVGALMAAGLDLVLAEVVPVTNSRRNDLLAEDKFRGTTTRYNFAFAGEGGRVYKVATLTTTTGTLEQVQIERRGRGSDYPTMIVAAERATWKPSTGWTLEKGEMGAHALHRRVGALRRRRQFAARRARSQDRHPHHVHHHRAVRSAARHQHAARRRGLRRRRQPGHHRRVFDDGATHEGDRQ
jgi:lipopolysaccharide export system permease protein